jgi:hypothetical protein
MAGFSREFAGAVEKLSPLHRALVAENSDPSTVSVDALMADLSTEFTCADAMHEWMESTRKAFAVYSLPGAVSPAACEEMRRMVDTDRRILADTVDGCPEHQLNLDAPREQLSEIMGAAACNRLLRLPAEYLRHEKQAARQQRRERDQRREREQRTPASHADGFEPFLPQLLGRLSSTQERSTKESSTTELSTQVSSTQEEEQKRDDVESESEEDPDAVQTLQEAFIRRYSADTRPFNPFHQDRFRLTINVALSSDEDHGGGRLLGVYDGEVRAIEREAGEATVHSSELVHAVTNMTHGVRYSLIIFISTRPRPIKREAKLPS